MAGPGVTRSFLVGETVHLTSRVSVVGTRTPVDPDSVTLTSLKRGGTEVLLAPESFTRTAEGQYVHTILTATLDPGDYTLVVTHSSGASRVALATDGFVLRAP